MTMNNLNKGVRRDCEADKITREQFRLRDTRSTKNASRMLSTIALQTIEPWTPYRYASRQAVANEGEWSNSFVQVISN